MMQKILVTGGIGYIGSHTILDLIENGYEVVSIDNFSRSNPSLKNRIEKIARKEIKNYNINICDLNSLKNVFEKEKDIQGIIHFAAFKSVPESVKFPALYYHNNITSLINIIDCAETFGIKNFVFSSSCSVYGNAKDLPVTEQTLLEKAESPYAFTKQAGEEIIRNFTANSNLSTILLRYFNPVGAHPSGLIGEIPLNRPENLFPFITQTGIGKLPQLTVFGNDYDTRDGSCIRDFIHVCDIAHAHTLALKFLQNSIKQSAEIFNLGTGNGVTVLEAVEAFEKISNAKLNYTIGPRRSGDVVSVYANNQKAREILGWNCKFNLEEMMATAWTWEKNLKENPL